jgi:hypothetical protein
MPIVQALHKADPPESGSALLQALARVAPFVRE